MSNKFENTLAQLHKLKNQMRIELNQIRPFRDNCFKHQDTVKKSQKKCFPNNYQQSNLLSPLLPKENSSKPERKRRIQSQTMPHVQFSRSFEKKHFDRHYNDSVNTEMNTKRTRSNYLNIKTERNQSSLEIGHGNSLVGIGGKDEGLKKSRSGIRVYPVQYIQRLGQGVGRRKSFFG